MQATIVVNQVEESTMGTVSVRIDEELVIAARKAAAGEFRTIQGQLEFWAKVGKAALDNPDLPVTFVADSLLALAEPEETATPYVPRSKK
ncbi:MAG: ParD-like family protein [Micrococcales bacterium]